ncbi:Endonuclease/exonuclease/phosphatase [Baffinella frigidus]|nr:Endonuclease/exonuclease/phosphatase [Cryptophyta sp. CCMP2293]
MLCPLFKRVGPRGEEVRESSSPELYTARNQEILDIIDGLDSDIVCLQEFWVQNEDFAQVFRTRLEGRYSWHQLERTGGRGDGLVTLLKHHIQIKDRRDITFKDLGDRVALLLRLRVPGSGEREGEEPPPTSPWAEGQPCTRELILVNTHLLFPHQPYFSIIRLRELRKILSFLELYRQQYREDMPIVMCGDFNGSPKDATYQLLRERNFTSSCADDTEWVTHVDHSGKMVCCDFVFCQNPIDRDGPMDTHWQAMIFRSTKQRFSTARKELQDEIADRGASQGGSSSWDSSEQAKWGVQPEEFRDALDRLGFASATKNLSDLEIEKLMTGPDRLFANDDERERVSAGLQSIVGQDRLDAAFAKLDQAAVDGQIDSGTFEKWWRVEMHPHFGGESDDRQAITRTAADLPILETPMEATCREAILVSLKVEKARPFLANALEEEPERYQRPSDLDM